MLYFELRRITFGTEARVTGKFTDFSECLFGTYVLINFPYLIIRFQSSSFILVSQKILKATLVFG